MELLETVETLGRTLIAKEHDHFIHNGVDNLDYILSLRRMIEGISDFLKSAGRSKQEIIQLSSCLQNYAKALFIGEWLNTSGDDEKETEEDIENLKDEAAKVFDHVYKKGKYPR